MATNMHNYRYTEVASLIYVRPKFLFRGPDDLERFSSAVPQRCLAAITRLELEGVWSVSAYPLPLYYRVYEVIRVRPPPSRTDWDVLHKAVLPRLLSLEELRITIAIFQYCSRDNDITERKAETLDQLLRSVRGLEKLAVLDVRIRDNTTYLYGRKDGRGPLILLKTAKGQVGLPLDGP
jgi:hypothetical protein